MLVFMFICTISLSQTPDVNGIYYVKPTATGTGTGDSWVNATADLESVIYYAGSGNKVFMAIGNYNVPTVSYKMKNNFEIYGGFDPGNGITNLTHSRILPSESVEGTVFNGQGARRVFNNDFSFLSLNSSAVLDGVTIKNGYVNNDNGAGMRNINASPTLRNIVVRNNNANNGAGGAIYNNNSSPSLTNVLILNNFSGANKAAYHSVNLSNSQITNSIFKGNSQRLIHTESASLNMWNVLMADNPAATVALAQIGSGNTNIYNSTILNINGSNNAIDAFLSPGVINTINSIIYGNSNTATLNTCLYSLNLTTVPPSTVFVDYTNGNYQLRYDSPAIDAGNNLLYSGLSASTKDLAGNPRVYQYSNGGIIDQGAYEFCIIPDATGIVYVKPTATGTGIGNSWANATSNFQGAIDATGTTKVFVAIGNYNAPLIGSFVMKNNVEIYGGFDPDNGISTLSHSRIMPSATVNGSVMNGQNQVTVVRNVFASGNPLNNTAILDGFTITNGNRTTTGYGGGIELQNASPILRNLVVKNNAVQDGGGAMGITQNSSPTISNIYLLDNTTPGISGGLIIQSNSNPTFTNVYFKGNSASNSTHGSSIANFSGCSPTFINLMLTTTANSTLNSISTTNTSGGTGILTLINASIYTASSNAAGVVPAINSIAGATVNVRNSIVYGANSTATGGVINLQSTQYYPTANTVLPTTIFVDPANYNFTLKEGSPAINVGDNSFYPGLSASTKDLAGNARLHLYGMGGIIDLGPYESAYLQPDANGVVYVKPAATGTGSGDSWANATGNLQLAINTTGVQKVFVSVGWYVTPTNGFVMKNNVEIYGGFNPGSGITDLSHQRQFFLGSVLSGENTVRVINNDFLSTTALNTTAVLDGFTITRGYVSNDFGAGMLNRNASPTLRYITFLNNHAVGTSGSGGAMANLNNSSPNLTNGSFTLNSADAQGAALYNASSSNGIFKTCQITNNECPDGSALYAVNSSPTIMNSRLSENHGLNTVSINGSSSGITFINVTVANNTQVNAGVSPNVLALGNGAVGAIKNSIVFGTISGAGSYTAQYSFIEGNSSTINGNVNTTGYTIADIYINPTNGSYDLKGTAPVINKGSNALYTGLNSNSTDMAGNPRLVGAIIDLGATEFIVSPGGNGIAYVKPTATGSGNGSSWANATADMQAAINATGTQKVFVAQGLYHVPSPSSYVMKNGVEIYGGFDPDNGISDLTHNRIMPGLGNQGSILDGNNERPIIWNYNNGVTSSAKLDGFTLTNAKGVNQGAIHNNAVSPTLTNLLIVNNDSYGIYNQSSSSTITNVAVLKNSGRGVHFSGVGNATLVNATIAGNGGEAVYALNTDPMSNFSVVLNNSVVYGTVTNTLSQATANYSLVENNALSGNNAVDATGVSANQVFVDTLNNDFTLKGGAPAIGVGSNTLFTGLTASTRDLLGNARLNGATIDLGAYEFKISVDANGIAYVKPTATGSGNGSS
ncbi:MAG TPA: right-handed parallel beta-helix repeat-containing protein, partial [Taishania sp.]|nr:right-handed parallel beta-helix repeat-containing protein [Taishania sp.]